MGVAVALPGVSDNSCLMKPGLAQLVKGTGGLFFGQGNEEATAGLWIKEDFSFAFYSRVFESNMWNSFCTVMLIDPSRDSCLIHLISLFHDRH